MSKRVYISADYDLDSGDRDVVNELNRWGQDNIHKVDFVDMAKVVSGSVSNNPDCRICDLKSEFNRQINASSYVIFVVGDKTALRTSGDKCFRQTMPWHRCHCTPYKGNAGGSKLCKVIIIPDFGYDISPINNHSYLWHEFAQAEQRGKNIIVVYNSLYKKASWLPSYLKTYESQAEPFWIKNDKGEIVGNYTFIKEALGYD